VDRRSDLRKGTSTVGAVTGIPQHDIIVIGAGLIGLATANQLLEQRPGLSLTVLEKEDDVALHQSGRNSGVIHAGLYYTPGSRKAELCREGMKSLQRFAAEHDIPFTTCGKLVVALDESERSRLEELKRRGLANGIKELRELRKEEIKEIEPHVEGVRALYVPETGIIDFRRVALAYADQVKARGGHVLLGRRVDAIDRRNGRSVVRCSGGEELVARQVIGCAGLHSDRVASLSGGSHDSYRIVPFRGDYYTFTPEARDLVRGLVYPVPDPSFPFLGVHFTRRIDGDLWAGPNAVPAFAREGYRRRHMSPRDLLGMLAFPGFRRLARAYARTGASEIWRDLVKRAFVADVRRYVPAVEMRHLTFGPSGVRAQCMRSDGTLVDDFLLEESEGAIHVLNAPSPAATASLAIARVLTENVIKRFGL
jgi:(S)-2-hydroxyglutarate dehydrogenase